MRDRDYYDWEKWRTDKRQENKCVEERYPGREAKKYTRRTENKTGNYTEMHTGTDTCREGWLN